MLIIKLSSLHFSPVILVFIYYLYVDIFPMYYQEPTNPHNCQPRGRSIEIRSRPRGLSCRFVINQFDLIIIKMDSGMNCINQANSIIDSRQLRFSLLICSFLWFILSFIFLIDEASSAFSAIFSYFLSNLFFFLQQSFHLLPFIELYCNLYYLWEQIIFNLQKAMEEVLRKLYQDHYKGLQRKRLQKVLEGQHYEQTARKKYDFSDQISRKTRQTTFSYDEDVRFEKEFQSNQKHILQNLASIQAKYHKYNFPSLTKKQPLSTLKQKFKAVVTAVIFLNRLQRKLRGKMIRRKRKVQKISENLVTMIEKMLRNYYEKLLQQELINYVALLQKKLQNPNIDQQKQTIQLLYYISEKLAHSTVIKELMDFFVYVATDKSFQPDDFLSSAEINRLDFSCMFGSIVNVSQQQTRMIIGLGLGIKIFCFYILFQPWNLSFAGENFRQNCKQIKQAIYNTGSVFYYLIYEQFCLNLKEVRTITKSKVLNLGSKAMKQLNPFKEGEVSNTSKAIIVGQTRFFLNDMELKYPHLLQGIKQNLFRWISRIAYVCLKENQKRDKLKDQSSTFSSTINSKEKGEVKTRNVFRSVELNRKRQQLINHNHDKRYNLPNIKRTIQ